MNSGKSSVPTLSMRQDMTGVSSGTTSFCSLSNESYLTIGSCVSRPAIEAFLGTGGGEGGGIVVKYIDLYGSVGLSISIEMPRSFLCRANPDILTAVSNGFELSCIEGVMDEIVVAGEGGPGNLY